MNPPDALADKLGWFIWNLSAFGWDPPTGIEDLLNRSWTNIVAIKTYDGTRAFIQDWEYERVRDHLAMWPDVKVGIWGYHYGHETQRELELAANQFERLAAEFLILNVEDPAIELNPHTGPLWAQGLEALRARLPDASIYFCSHAQPSYHPRQPYYQATDQWLLQQPMIYHTAMQMGPRYSVEVSHDDFEKWNLLEDTITGEPFPWSSAGAAYATPGNPITRAGVSEWAAASLDHGASSLIWWDGDVAQHDDEVLGGVRDAALAWTQRKGPPE